MPYEVPSLAYSYDALDRVIDEQTMRLHHDKHHQAYVDKVNGALAGTEWGGRPIEEVLRGLSSLPADKQAVVRNNGGGHANHTLFWASMGPDGGGEPSGELREAITETFGSVGELKKRFEENGIAQFGSGWTWLTLRDGQLDLGATPNQDSPLIVGAVPLLGNDVWEHAYYLRYQNRRADYLKAWWDVVDWSAVDRRYVAARASVA